jgi:nitrogen regulatory protein P-II 1
MYQLSMVLDDSTRLDEVLIAWRDAGIRGITVFESTGINRILPRHEASPMYSGFSQIFGGGRVGHYTLIAVIDSLELAEAAVASTEVVMGDLSQPHTGIIWATPVTRTWGIRKENNDEDA